MDVFSTHVIISGFVVRSKCEKNEICMDNNTNSNRDKRRVIVDIDEIIDILLNMSEIVLEVSRLSEARSCRIAAVIVFADDSHTAKAIEKSLSYCISSSTTSSHLSSSSQD